MKKYLVVLLAAFGFHSVLFAKIITVSNNPNSPGQYRRLDTAIMAAAAGDVLLVSGSTIDYAAAAGGTIVINRPLTIYGAGYDPRTDQPLVSMISTIHITAAGTGTTISGFLISNQIYEDPGTNYITISRCKIASMWNSSSYTYGINGSNYLIKENIIGVIAIGVYTMTTAIGHIIIQNNIITGSIGGPAIATDIVINNNYFSSVNAFAGAGYSGALYNASINNNIFYYKSTSSAPASNNSVAVNCVFNNNIYYNTTSTNPLSIGVNNNTGSKNTSVNPLFANIDLTSTSVTRLDNFNLLAGSPGINAGTDGKNIGPSGGSQPIQYPYSGAPAIPQVLTMNIINSVIPPNGTLNVNFTATSNN